MKLFPIILIVLIGACAAMITDEETLAFHKYMRDFGISPKMEYLSRKKIFTENYQKIKNHNLRFEQGLETYMMAINKFTAYTIDELVRSRTNGFDRTIKHPLLSSFGKHEMSPAKLEKNLNDLPEKFDWREKKGVVREVQDQGEDCQSSWAFSGIAAIEGQMAILFNSTEKLSEQEVVGCNPGSCSGSKSTDDLVYWHSVEFGITTEAENPYRKKDNDIAGCNIKTPRTPHSMVVGWKVMVNEKFLQSILVQDGPISTVLGVTEDFINIGKGIFTDPTGECTKMYNSSEYSIQFVLIVGYGSENGIDYWIVKNSWGTDWGDSGYFRIKRGENVCGIGLYATLPVLENKNSGNEIRKVFKDHRHPKKTSTTGKTQNFLITLTNTRDYY